MDVPFPPPPIFEAVIHPYRSLSRRGARVVAGAIFGLTALVGVRVWLMGAWPVVGFSVPESILVVWLMRLNMARARAHETIRLSADTLEVLRVDRHGRPSGRALPTAWVNVLIEERPGRIPALLLTTRTLREEVASFLGEDEKRDLANALQTALRGLRHPVFDNPQLREGPI